MLAIKNFVKEPRAIYKEPLLIIIDAYQHGS